jgi:hypothetical protein
MHIVKESDNLKEELDNHVEHDQALWIPGKSLLKQSLYSAVKNFLIFRTHFRSATNLVTRRQAGSAYFFLRQYTVMYKKSRKKAVSVKGTVS